MWGSKTISVTLSCLFIPFVSFSTRLLFLFPFNYKYLEGKDLLIFIFTSQYSKMREFREKTRCLWALLPSHSVLLLFCLGTSVKMLLVELAELSLCLEGCGG